MSISPRSTWIQCLGIVLSVAIATATARAATVTWTGAAGGTNWSDTGNWSSSPLGASDDAVFTDVAGAAAHGTLTNAVDTDVTLKSLSYQLGATPVGFFHTTQIASGKTLLLTGGLSVAPISVGTSADPTATVGKLYPIDVTFLGPNATLQVGSSGTYTANLVVGRSAGTGTGVAYSSHSSGKLDLSGLDNFAANLNTMVLAHGIDWSNEGLAELTLATNNTIAANSIETGRGTGAAKIYLGENNTIRADSFSLNLGKGNSAAPLFTTEMRFRNGLANPVLNLTGLNSAGVDLAIANNSTSATGATNNNVVDLSGGTFNATIDELTIGRFIYANAGGDQGTLIMTAGTATANTLTMAVTNSTSPLNTKGTLTLRGGTFTVLGSISDGAGTSTINVEGGTFASRGTMALDNLNLGATTTAATLDINGLVSGTRQVVACTQGANGKLLARLNAFGPGSLNATTATLANGSKLELHAVMAPSTDPADQTRWTAGSGTWDSTHANWSDGTPAGFTVANNTAYTVLQAATLTNNGLSLVNSPGWTLTVTPGANGSAVVARTGGDLITGPVRAVLDSSTAAVTRPTNLTVAEAAGSDAALLEVKAGSLTVGDATTPAHLTLGNGTAAGQLLQSGGTITVNGNVQDGGESSVDLNRGTLGVTGNFQVDHLLVGSAGSGSLNLTGTGTSHRVSSGITMASGIGSTGTLGMLGGTFAVTGGISDAGGTSTLNVDGGTATIAGGLNVDALRVGSYSGIGSGQATMTVTSGAVVIGPSGNLDIGRRTVGSGSGNLESRLDLRNAASVQITVDNVWLGLQQDYAGANVGAGVPTYGTLLLSQNGTNTINARQILLGDVPGGAGASSSASKITFGRATNTVNTDRLTLGGRKGWGAADILAGGTLNLSGLTTSNDQVDLYLGDNDVATNSRSIGSLDLTGGTLNATLGQVFIGRSPQPSDNGYGSGTFVMDAGNVAANRVRMAETANTKNPQLTTATFTLRGGSFTVNGDVTSGTGVTTLSINGGSLTADKILLASGSTAGQATLTLAGGTLSAASIGKGEGSLAFNFTGGTLHVGAFGTSANRMSLVQTGGTLSPGNSVGLTTIEGNYQLTSGTLALELDGLAGAGLPGGHDQLVVNGDVALAGDLDLMLHFAPTLGTSLVLLDNRGSNAIVGTFSGLAEQSDVDLLFGDETYTFSITYQGGDGNDVVLSMGIVPEPTAVVLLLVGVSLLLGMRRGRYAFHSGISSREGSSDT